MPQSTEVSTPPNGFLEIPPTAPQIVCFSDEDKEKHVLKFPQSPVKGQGVVIFSNEQRERFKVSLSATEDFKDGIFLDVVKKCDADETRLVIKNGMEPDKTFTFKNVFIDDEARASYWISFSSEEKEFKYGVGEAREDLVLLCCKCMCVNDMPPDLTFVKLSEDLKLECFQRDPVVIDPPLAVIPVDEFTMENAAKSSFAVPANLTSICQKLYGNISGGSFKLNTDDFPCFTDAIEASIRNKDGWCYRTLKSKAGEFPGGELKTYLRITLGVNQGESPGIPYVMEIWPPGHSSPIHRHAEANAIIRVLHGQIHVCLYKMLSIHHDKPFQEADFREGDVTWISPTLNQTHMLENRCCETCITIQCYMYAAQDNQHYEYFDYLVDKKKGEIKHFYPHSDCDFLVFKEKMKEEYCWKTPKMIDSADKSRNSNSWISKTLKNFCERFGAWIGVGKERV